MSKQNTTAKPHATVTNLPQEKPNASEKGSKPHSNPTQHIAPVIPIKTKTGCLVTNCREKDVRLNFCEEHFKQFKFGLVTKKGELVADFEKKFEHYQNWISAQKAA